MFMVNTWCVKQIIFILRLLRDITVSFTLFFFLELQYKFNSIQYKSSNHKLSTILINHSCDIVLQSTDVTCSV
jgi:fumarate reductase subunit C